MRTHEIHTLSTAHDVAIAQTVGLPLHHPEAAGSTCSNCGEQVGPRGSLFIPFALVLSAEDESWLLCLLCAQPTVRPQG